MGSRATSARRAGSSCSDWRRTASASTSSPARWPRTASRCCQLDRVFGGVHSANEIEQQTGLPAGILIRNAASAGAAAGRARRQSVLRRGHRGGPLDQAVHRRRVRPGARSSRSRASWAKGWRGWRRPSPRRSPSTFLQAGDSEDGGRGPLRGAGRAADAGADAGAGGGVQGTTCRQHQPRRCWDGPSSRPATSPAVRSWRSASPIWSASRGSAVEVELHELGHGRRQAGAAGRLGHRGPGPADQDDRRRGDVRQPGPGAAGRGRARARGGRRGRRAAKPARRDRGRAGAAARRRLLRQLGQPRQPRDRGRAPRERALHARRCATRPARTVCTGRRRAATASRAYRARAAVSRARLREPPEGDGSRWDR